MNKDVVCGMQVSEQHARERAMTANYHGVMYYFCSKTCRKKFNQNPQLYAAPGPSAQQGQKVT